MTASAWSALLADGAQEHLDRAISAAVTKYAKRKPASDDVAQRLQAVEGAVGRKDCQIRKMELDFYGYKQCIENGVPPELLAGFALHDEPTISAKVAELGEALAARKAADLTHKILTEGHKPGGGGSPLAAARTVQDYEREAAKRRHG